jgi:putative SOS response-associated peptidase YedK
VTDNIVGGADVRIWNVNRNPPTLARQWLDPRASADVLRSLLVPYTTAKMEARPVGLWVNNPKNDGPKCLEPAIA